MHKVGLTAICCYSFIVFVYIHVEQTQVVFLPEVVQGPTIISVNLSCADALQVGIKTFLIPMYS